MKLYPLLFYFIKTEENIILLSKLYFNHGLLGWKSDYIFLKETEF